MFALETGTVTGGRARRDGVPAPGPGPVEWVSELVWRGGAGIPLGRLLATGAFVWLAYALVWLAVDGPVLDEAAIAAPVITSFAGYPSGHPNAVLYRGAALASYQLGALEWGLRPDPWSISASRNVLFLFLSSFVPFAIVVAATRQPSWGHVAAALTLSESVCSAVGVYLMWVFPGVYSTGHVGIHVALLATVLVAAGVGRLGGFLTGVLPAVHASMTLVAWPAVALLLLVRKLGGRPVRVPITSGIAGLVVAAAVAAAVAWRTASDVAFPPWDVHGDDSAILRTFTATTDPHRQPLPLWSIIGLFGPGAFAVLAALALAPGCRVRLARGALAGAVLAGGLAWACALGARAFQAAFGELPLPLAIVMPARLANLGMLCIVPLATIVLATRTAPAAGRGIALVLLVVEAVLLGVARHVAFVHLLHGIVGAAVGAAWAGADTAGRRRVALVGMALVAAALAVVRAPDGSVVLGSFVLGVVLAAITSAVARRRVPGAALAIACGVVAVLALRPPHPANLWDFGSERRSAEEADLAGWLAANAPPDAMLLAPPFPPTWLQPKTGRPVLFDMMTLLSMTYFPTMAEPVSRLVRDVFEVDYADPAAIEALLGPDGKLRPSSPVWLRAWGPRPCPAWHELGARWGFAFVLSPRATRLALAPVWTGPTWTLYRVPRDVAECLPAGGVP